MSNTFYAGFTLVDFRFDKRKTLLLKYQGMEPNIAIIKSQIARMKMTHQELADKAGLTRQTIYNLLNNKFTPDLATLDKIATALMLPSNLLIK